MVITCYINDTEKNKHANTTNVVPPNQNDQVTYICVCVCARTISAWLAQVDRQNVMSSHSSSVKIWQSQGQILVQRKPLMAVDIVAETTYAWLKSLAMTSMVVFSVRNHLLQARSWLTMRDL